MAVKKRPKSDREEYDHGATEYHSDMFKDDYLAVWLVAIEDYYLN